MIHDVSNSHSGSAPAHDRGPFDADKILELSRSLTAVITDDGAILDARGGFGRFLGWETQELIGRSVFDFVPPEHVEQLITYFLENDGVTAEALAFSAPFRIPILDPLGLPHVVDVIPTGVLEPLDGTTTWVLVVVPVALFGSITRSLDLEMTGADRSEVSRMLCEELSIDDDSYTTRWVLVDLRAEGGVECTTAREADAAIAEAVRDDVLGGWTPWRGVEADDVQLLTASQVGGATHAAMHERGWQRAIVAPIHLGDQLVAAYLQLGRVPDAYVFTALKTNVADRIGRLVRATALLMRRWDDQEQLRIAATYDSLTGLHNARSLRDALDSAPENGSVLFVDVDRFKPVNDTFGHVVGDRVLERIADRIVDSCRDGDFVARVGGDEFFVLLEGADTETAATVAARIMETVALPLGLDEGPDRVTVSVGQASLESADAFDAADQAMLSAKRSGRSRLSIADD